MKKSHVSPSALPSRLSDDRQLLTHHVQLASALFKKYHISEQRPHADLFESRSKDSIDRFIEFHYAKGASIALEMTHSLVVAIAYLYHGIEDRRRIDALDLVGLKPKDAHEVRRALYNYQEVKYFTHSVYASQQVGEHLCAVLANEPQYLVRVLDEWNRLMAAMYQFGDMRVNRLEIAEKILGFYSPVVHRLNYHVLDMAMCDHAFAITNPATFTALFEALYGKDAEKGVNYYSSLQSAMIKVLSSHLTAYEFEGDVSVRLKSIYSIFRKLHKKKVDERTGQVRYGYPEEKILAEARTLITELNDLLAARIVLAAKYKDPKHVKALENTLGEQHGAGLIVPPPKAVVGTLEARKDYYETPPTDRPYYSIHLMADLPHMVERYLPMPKKRIANNPTGIQIVMAEVQLRRLIDDIECRWGGRVSHGGYKAFILGESKSVKPRKRSFEDVLTDVITDIKDRQDIKKPIRVIVTTEKKATALDKLARSTDAPFETASFNTAHLRAKLMFAAGGEMETYAIESHAVSDDSLMPLMDTIYRSKAATIVVVAAKSGKSCSIDRVLVYPSK